MRAFSVKSRNMEELFVYVFKGLANSWQNIFQLLFLIFTERSGKKLKETSFSMLSRAQMLGQPLAFEGMCQNKLHLKFRL